MSGTRLLVLTLLSGLIVTPVTFGDVGRLRVAVFPLAGSAEEGLRDKVAFSIRQKLSRDGQFEMIEGVTIAEIMETAKATATFETPAEKLTQWIADEKPSALVWGEVNGGADGNLAGATIRLKVVNLLAANPNIAISEKQLNEPTDLRFAIEEAIQLLPGVKPATRPNELVLVDDKESRLLWEKNPSLIANGNFSELGSWEYWIDVKRSPVPAAITWPTVNRAQILVSSSGVERTLAMHLSREAAETTGLSALSDPVVCQPGRRYRLSVRLRTQGPSARVFVKGYTAITDAAGKSAMRECFRTESPQLGPEKSDWQTMVFDVNPYHVQFPVQTLRVQLFAFIGGGKIEWDDVTLKDIGEFKSKPKDAAIVPPVTRPTSSRP